MLVGSDQLVCQYIFVGIIFCLQVGGGEPRELTLLVSIFTDQCGVG